jgi:hypothetical protein
MTGSSRPTLSAKCRQNIQPQSLTYDWSGKISIGLIDFAFYLVLIAFFPAFSGALRRRFTSSRALGGPPSLARATRLAIPEICGASRRERGIRFQLSTKAASS